MEYATFEDIVLESLNAVRVLQICKRCDGSKKILQWNRGVMRHITVQCDVCEGTGQTVKHYEFKEKE